MTLTMHRQFNVSQQVWNPDLQLSKTGHGDRIEEFFRQLQFSDGRLDGAFPQGCGADVDDAAGIANGGSGPIRQGVRLAKRPKQGVGVLQVAHWRQRIPRSRAMSSGHSSKSSARRIRPFRRPRRRLGLAGSKRVMRTVARPIRVMIMGIIYVTKHRPERCCSFVPPV